MVGSATATTATGMARPTTAAATTAGMARSTTAATATAGLGTTCPAYATYHSFRYSLPWL